MTLTEIIRSAIINTDSRSETYDVIAEDAGCTRPRAKQLYYAFLYFAKEEYLQGLLACKYRLP